MRNQSRSKDLRVQETLDTYHSNQDSSISKAAHAFKIPHSTMKHHVAERISQTQAQEPTQNLSNTEEIMLMQWITHLTTTGFPTSRKLILEIAEEIHCECVFFTPQATSTSLKLRPIGHN